LLSALHELPFDAVKLDRAFVEALPERAASRETARAIVRLAQAQDRSVVVEGIETPAQLAFVRELECCLPGLHARCRRRRRARCWGRASRCGSATGRGRGGKGKR
jgi:predicted signal transduction protein with EAL and GGDEF domain